MLAGAARCSPAPPTLVVATEIPAITSTPTQQPTPAPILLPDFSLCWVTYSPTHYDPDIPRFPLPSNLGDDLTVLHAAGFQGILTYSSRDRLGEIPALAKEIGFRQVIMGIWDPLDEQERNSAIAAAPYVEGYIVGNEGLADERYTFGELRAVLDLVRSATGKPVTTTERLEIYYGLEGLMELGDWLAPIVHPFWHDYFDPAEAAEWTVVQFEDLQEAAPPNRIIQVKELGLPTAGHENVSEAAQAEYYRLLQQSEGSLQFAYFEAFDQEWKAATTGLPLESHWGLFRTDRSPKPVVDLVCGKTPGAPSTLP
jgi:exo-beta-1,3-glucanase (GH17 family)